MNKLIKYRYLFMLPSALIIIAGLVVLFTLGFNTGIDFSSGLFEQIQIAPVGFDISYSGDGSANLSAQQGVLKLTIKESGNTTIYEVDPNSYKTVNDAAYYLGEIKNITINIKNGSLDMEDIVVGANFPVTLSSAPFHVNFATNSDDVSISDIRTALSPMNGLNVQVAGNKSDGIFSIKVKVDEGETQRELESQMKSLLLELASPEEIVTLQSDFVGPKFSSTLFTSSIKAVVIAVALILVYIWVRFRFSYAISSIIALLHDVLMMFAFILIFRLEVSSTTIAAVLTIIGYSLNNTIVIFDRIRENVIYVKGNDVDRTIIVSIKESLSRTIITSLTTLFAVIPLAIFTTGAIKGFAINLVWGVLVGTYSSNFIAPVLLRLFHKIDPINKVKEKKKDESYHIGDAYV